MKLDHQHRPFWGFVERHVRTIIIIELAGALALLWGYTHIDTLVNLIRNL
jgi:hypothetical protein